MVIVGVIYKSIVVLVMADIIIIFTQVPSSIAR